MADKKLMVVFGAKTTDLEKAVKQVNRQMKDLAIGMTAFGAAITGALALAGKAAIDEQINVNRLAATMKNVGVEYESVKDKLEGLISASERKTGVADDKQRDALAELVTVTGDYNTALSLLPLALDTAAAKQMDLGAAATLVGRVALGDTEILSRYGIAVQEGASATEVLTQMQERFGGTAEATANPLTILQNTMSNLAETIGGALLPVIQPLIAAVTNVAESVRDWMEANPEATKSIVMVVGALAALAGGLGTAILLGPKIMAVIHGIGFAFKTALGPIGLALGAVTFLFTAWQSNMFNIREVTEKVVEAIVHAFGWLWDKIMIGAVWVFRYITLIPRALSEVLKAVGLDNLAAPIDNALQFVEDRINEFREKSVSAMADFDVSFAKTAETVETKANTVTDALSGMTMNSINALKKYQEEVKKMTEEGYAKALGNIAVPVAEGFVNTEHQSAMQSEAQSLMEQSKAATAAGNPEQASFLGMMAAQAFDRLRRNENIFIQMDGQIVGNITNNRGGIDYAERSHFDGIG